MTDKLIEEMCRACGGKAHSLRVGWTNFLYCSESCELSHVSEVHASMPGGPLPRPNWVPHHIAEEIRRRWDD